MLNLTTYFSQGPQHSLSLLPGSNFSYKGNRTLLPSVSTSIEIDRWYVGNFASATYFLHAEADSNNKESMHVLVTARPEGAAYTIFGRTTLTSQIVTLSASVNDSYLILYATPNTGFVGTKVSFTATYAETIFPLGIPTQIVSSPIVGGGDGAGGGGSGTVLTPATTTALGGVIIDGVTITTDITGKISTIPSAIKAAAAAMLTGGTQTGISFTYNAGTGTMTSIVSGGAGGSGITGVSVQNTGVTAGSVAAVTTLNFTGTGVLASVSGSVATISVSAVGSASLSDTNPLTPGSGNLWLNTNTGQLFVYTGTEWIQPVALTSAGGSGGSSYTLPTASTTVLGGVKVDGTTITINNGAISSTGSASNFIGGTVSGATTFQNIITGATVANIIPFYYASQATFPNAASYDGALAHSHADGKMYFAHSGVWNALANAGDTLSLPTASTTVLGGVKVDGSTITINGSGVISSTGGSVYTLPTATTSVLGGVKVDGTTVTINGSGIITANYTTYSLPLASTTVLGGVKIDGSTLAFNGNGQLYYTGSGVGGYTLPTASTTQLGGVKVDGTTVTINGTGVISSTSSYTLTTATTSTLGGVKVDGTTVTINGSGVITANYTTYTLPTATTSVLGGVKVDGTSITIASGVISAASTASVPTYPAITRLDVTNNGASSYQFNNQYSGDNPTIYAISGTTIAFNLNVSGHPFLIRNSGTNFNTGLIHVSTTGVVSTGSNAQGQQTGTLYWQIPQGNSGATFSYNCSIHSGMVGTINIKQISNLP